MKTSTLCLTVCISIGILVVAILFQRPKSKEKTKEGFVATLIEEDWKVSMGVGVAVGVVAILLIGFIVYYFTQPKKYNGTNVVPQYRQMYLNMY